MDNCCIISEDISGYTSWKCSICMLVRWNICFQVDFDILPLILFIRITIVIMNSVKNNTNKFIYKYFYDSYLYDINIYTNQFVIYKYCYFTIFLIMLYLCLYVYNYVYHIRN